MAEAIHERINVPLMEAGYTTASLSQDVRTHRELLGLTAVDAGKAWCRQVQAYGPWGYPYLRLESSVYGIGTHTLSELIARGLIFNPDASGPLALTPRGSQALAALTHTPEDS